NRRDRPGVSESDRGGDQRHPRGACSFGAYLRSVRTLLDENLPQSVRRALRERGHDADSVTSLKLKGLDNGRLYRDVAQRYELCFSRDRAFVDGVRAVHVPGNVRILRVTIRQAPG